MARKSTKTKKNTVEFYKDSIIATLKVMRDSRKDPNESKIWNDVVQFIIQN